MIFKWLDTKDVDALAERLVRDLMQRLPPAALGADSRKAEAKQRKSYEGALSQARAFAQEHKLNVYTKARLANRFKWALAEAGYPPEFVTEMTYELAAVVASDASRGH